MVSRNILTFLLKHFGVFSMVLKVFWDPFLASNSGSFCAHPFANQTSYPMLGFINECETLLEESCGSGILLMFIVICEKNVANLQQMLQLRDGQKGPKKLYDWLCWGWVRVKFCYFNIKIQTEMYVHLFMWKCNDGGIEKRHVRASWRSQLSPFLIKSFTTLKMTHPLHAKLS